MMSKLTTGYKRFSSVVDKELSKLTHLLDNDAFGCGSSLKRMPRDMTGVDFWGGMLIMNTPSPAYSQLLGEAAWWQKES